MLIRRTIRGMLPFKRARGRSAFKNVQCYIGVPESLKGKEVSAIKGVGVEKLHSADYLKVKDICKAIGWK